MSDLLSLRLGAEAGDPRAQATLAYELLVGRAMPQDTASALRFIKSACDQKFAEAMLFHAALAALGFGRPQSYEEAYDLVARAAKAGSGAAKGQLAALHDAKGQFDLDVWRATPDVVQHVDAPRIFTIKRFIPKPACAWLISIARKRLKAASALGDQTSAVITSSYRSNKVAGFNVLEPDLVVQMINLRIAGTTGVPVGQQEATNVLRYGVGEENKPHFDCFVGRQLELFADEIKVTGQRIGTLLIYLNEGYGDGETDFPLLHWRFKGETGDAILFWNVTPQGEPEPLSRHAGLPVAKGEKWVLSKWMRAKAIPLNRALPSVVGG